MESWEWIGICLSLFGKKICEWGKKMKKSIRLSLFITALIITFSGCSDSDEATAELPETMVEEVSEGIALGDATNKNNTDVVLVMDKSGSMAKADPNRFAIEGAKLFVDMEKFSGVNVALVEFSDETRSTGLIEIKQKQNKDYLKAVLDSVSYAGKAHTDTGAGMLEAISVLDQSGNDNEKAIILFTDGRTDIDPGTYGRTLQDSIDDTDKAVQMAAEKGYTIYCIGLNSDGNVDEKELAKMAAKTNGKYHIASDVDELRDFFSSIFMDIDNTKEKPVDEYTADGDYHDSVFTIDNACIAEANIIILSSRPVEDCILLDNNEKRVDLENDEDVIFSKSRTYSLIKLINPAEGEWTISVKGITDDQIRIELIYNFNFNLMVEMDRTSVLKGESVNIKAYLASEGKVISESNLYEDVKASASFRDNHTGQENKEELNLNENRNAFEGKITLSELTDYDVSVHMEGNGFLRDSDIFTITVKKHPVIQIKDIEEQEVRVGQVKMIDLEEYFQNEDSNKVSVETQGQVADVEIQDSLLKIKGRSVGETTAFIYASNDSGKQSVFEFRIRCTTFWIKYRIVAIICSILILLLLIVVFFNRRRKIEGRFKISIDYGHNVNGMVKKQTFDILNSIPVSSFGKKSFNADRLLKISRGYYEAMEYDQKRKEVFIRCVNEILTEAKRIRFVGGRNPYGFKVKKNSDKVQFINAGHIIENNTLLVCIRGKFPEVSAGEEKKFGMCFKCGDEGYTQINIIYKEA